MSDKCNFETKKYRTLSWYAHGEMIKNLKTSMSVLTSLKNDKFDCIYPIPRGGLVLAVSLSHFLNIPLILNKAQLLNKDKNVLVVDDLIDTGKTFSDLKKFSKTELKIATLFYKPQHDLFNCPPNFYVKNTDAWIVFPWETIESTESN